MTGSLHRSTARPHGPRARRRSTLRRRACSLAALVLLVLSACSAPPGADGSDPGQTSGAADATDAGGARAARDAAVAQGGRDASPAPRESSRDASPGADDAGSASALDAASRGAAPTQSSTLDASDGELSDAAVATPSFVLTPVGFPRHDQELTFPASANPPTNASPEFTWSGVPAGSRSLALVFRDLGNGAVKWILWDIPPSSTGVPPNLSKVAHPAEVPGSSQLGSLDNQGYAGPGSGARQYDFKLWALDVERLPGTAGLTTLQIHDELLPQHDLASTPPVLVRNTRNLP